MSREPRNSFRILAVLLGTAVFAGEVPAQTPAPQSGIPVPSMAACDALISNGTDGFIDRHGVAGLVFTLSRNGKTVYDRGFGNANLAETEHMRPYHRFRIASVSKSITAIAIYKLMEELAGDAIAGNELSLDDTVFGPGGLLAQHPDLAGIVIEPPIDEITLRHLLEHSAGWDRTVQNCKPNPPPPYSSSIPGCDPIDFPLHVTQVLGRPNPATEEALIQFLLEWGSDFEPGTEYAYSNIGYLVVGEIIETLSGQPYEAFVRSRVLNPIGIHDTELARNLLVDKQEREVEYAGPGILDLSAYGNGVLVPLEYGGMNVEAMDAHGGWISTGRDLVKLLAAADGFSTKPDMLSWPSISDMTAPSTTNAGYAKGWAVTACQPTSGCANWWHTGYLPGTASMWASTATAGEFNWAILVNSEPSPGSGFWNDLDALAWECIAATTSWPTHDLMLSPSVAASAARVTRATGGARLAWTSGDGVRRLVVASPAAAPRRFPLDGSNYSAVPTYGAGSDLGDGNYVVYDGTGAEVIISGLVPDTLYRLRVFEYNRSVESGNHALYLLGDGPTVIALNNGKAPACADEGDNDGDGFVDLADPDCSGPSDNTEAPAPPSSGCGIGPELAGLLLLTARRRSRTPRS